MSTQVIFRVGGGRTHKMLPPVDYKFSCFLIEPTRNIAFENRYLLSRLPTNTLDINTIVLFSEENGSSNPPLGTNSIG
jgi:hypothetical protein